MTVRIERITCINGVRIARGSDHNAYKVGPVGDDLLPWIVVASERYGVDLELPEDLYDVQVMQVHTDRPKNADGYFPKTAAPWSALGAPDLPTREA